MSEAHASTDSIEQEGAGAPRHASLTSPAVLGVVLVLLAIVAYANAIEHPFVYDDLPLVLKNPAIRSLSNVPEMVGIGDGGLTLQARWTRAVTYTLEYALVGAWPPLYHATNIGLHALVGLLIFVLLAGLSERPWLGFWAAALFLVHPVNTEVVAHVAGRRDLLAAFFTLSALVLLARYLAQGGVWRVPVALAAFYLGVFSKEVALVGPVAFAGLDLWSRVRLDPAPGTLRAAALAGKAMLRERWRLYGVLALFTLAVGSLLLFASERSIGLAGSPGFYDTAGPGIGLIDRARVVGLGLRLLILPVGQTVDYSFDALELVSGSLSTLAVVDLIVLLATACLVAWGLARRNWAGFAGAWFLLFYAPHLGVIPWHEIFAERFLYLAGIGFCVAAAAGGLTLAGRLRHPAYAATMGCAVLALLTTATVLRNEDWSSASALWSLAVARYPNCARAHKALGDVAVTEARPDLALEHYQTAVRILPRYRDAQVGVALAHMAQRDFSGALAAVEQVLAQWPDEPKAWNLKGYILQSMGDNEQALAAYERAVHSDPRFAEGYNNMAQLYVERGDVEGAIKLYERALSHDPAFVTALQNLATIYREAMRDEVHAREYEARVAQLKRVR